MKGLRKSHEKEFSQLQSKKEASADVATKRYVDLMRGRFGISRKEWKKAMEEWEKKMDAKSEEESGSSASSDRESGTRKSEKERGNYEECGGVSYPSMIGTSSSFLPNQETFGETGMEREVSDKQNGTGKQRRRTVAYDMGKIPVGFRSGPAVG